MLPSVLIVYVLGGLSFRSSAQQTHQSQTIISDTTRAAYVLDPLSFQDRRHPGATSLLDICHEKHPELSLRTLAPLQVRHVHHAQSGPQGVSHAECQRCHRAVASGS